VYRATLASGYLYDSIRSHMQGPGVLPGNPCTASRLESERPRKLPSRTDLESGWRVHTHGTRVLPMERVIADHHPRIAILPRPVGSDVDVLPVLVIVSHTLTLAVGSDTYRRSPRNEGHPNASWLSLALRRRGFEGRRQQSWALTSTSTCCAASSKDSPRRLNHTDQPALQ
jgi:hypothetical protein